MKGHCSEKGGIHMAKIEELRQKLREKGIEFTEEELDGLFTKDGELSEEML